MDTDLWALALVVLAGFLAGGAFAMWRINKALAAALAACTFLALAAGVLRLGYL
ncbi:MULTISPECIES: hypothetical protein [unclassified Nocardiopsis]|uniref:hypothetical protein n=1 Tax=unclassified Nocardiopsis TaxID=2649073 RepID=UPI00191564E7|nr:MULTISPECIES: hypothetical protein [unclassified Nocardiopsis]